MMQRILIIDDDSVEYLRVKRLLKNNSEREYHIDAVNNVNDGRDAILNNEYDAYLIDMFIGAANGLDLIKEMRADGNNHALILLTGNSSLELESQAIRYGASDFLDKNNLSSYLLDRSIRYSIERIQIEKNHLHNERLATVGTLAAGIAHQFNNINTMVTGNLELIMRKHDLPDVVSERIHRALKSLSRASSITNTLLSFSKMNNSREVDSLEHVAEDIAILLNTNSTLVPISIQLDKQHDNLALINRSLIGQVALNFAVNARHAVAAMNPDDQEAKITLRTGNRNSQVFLRVTDNGCGMSKEEIKKIFTPFYTTKGEFSQNGSSHIKGTGLGLSLCDSIISNHGGSIEVTSDIDCGTAMTLWLPQAENESFTESYKTQSIRAFPVQEKHLRILVVDDEHEICDILSSAIEEDGHRCDIQSNPAKALEMIRENTYDLITLDQQMPDMNGCEVLERIRNGSNNNTTPIIIISGWLTENDRIAAHKLGAMCCIEKPFSISEVLSLVHDLHTSNQS
ncbi:MAG: response regulator [Planctomycetes bacterium]|nr:response regulator [Planctomycetota bacterium]